MRTMRALTLTMLAAAAAFGAGGCTKHQTELILVIATEGVRIPEDVHKVHLTVQDRQPSLDDTVYDADVELCNPNLTTSCYDIPVTAVLFPGKARANDSVRVRVDAIGSNGIVIADAALFTFAEEQSLRLDFVLYANCLGNVACAERDQACGPLDTCIDLHPGPTSGPLDLAQSNPQDLSMSLPPDMTMVDLAGADLTPVPPDLTSQLDMAGCTGVTCDMGEQCVAGVCQPCGNYRDPCCFSGTTGTCNQTNLACNGQICLLCGGDGQLCCPNMVPSCLAPDVCMAGTCQMPPVMDMSMTNDMSLTVSDMGVSGSLDLF
jgi:hypothetical protein